MPPARQGHVSLGLLELDFPHSVILAQAVFITGLGRKMGFHLKTIYLHIVKLRMVPTRIPMAAESNGQPEKNVEL